MASRLYQFRLTSDVSHLERVRLWAANIARTAGLDDRAVFEVEISVYEACANVVEHAYKNAPGKFIDLAIVAEGRKLTVIVQDDGGVFDPAGVRDKNIRLLIENEQDGGLGLFIIEACMDEILYRRHGGRNTLEMVKYLPPAVALT